MGPENVKVVARVRPALQTTDKNEQPFLVCNLSNSTITIKKAGKADTTYCFNKIFNGHATQETIFDNVGLPIVDGFLSGINGTAFAYGQTGSGKTHTMLGSDDIIEDHGMIPRAIKRIFEWLDAEVQEKSGTFKFTLKVSFLQIYNEIFYDLLNKNSTEIEIYLSTVPVTVKGAAEIEVTTPEECMEQLQKGLAQRKTAETLMNRESSRSHAVFMLALETETCENGITKTRSSRLNLVDLAGSENAKQTGNIGAQLREAGNINKSLLVLARVIRQIITTPNQRISYPDSLLTKLLRDSLGGNSKATVLVNLHSHSHYINQTISTLEFAKSIKEVKNTTKINERLSCKEVDLLKTENGNLRQENTKLISEISKLEEESNIQKEHTKVIEAKLVESEKEATKSLQQKDDEINQLHINNTAKMEELYIQMTNLQAENDAMKRLKTFDEKATQCDEIIKETNEEFVRPCTPPLRSRSNTIASSVYRSNDTVRQSEVFGQTYQSHLSNEEARVPSSNEYSMTSFPHQTFQSNPSTTMLSNSIEAVRASVAEYPLNSFMSQTIDNSTLTDRSCMGRFSQSDAKNSLSTLKNDNYDNKRSSDEDDAAELTLKNGVDNAKCSDGNSDNASLSLKDDLSAALKNDSTRLSVIELTKTLTSNDKITVSSNIASSSIQSDVIDVVQCLLNIISFNEVYRKNENVDVVESSAAFGGFNAAQKQSEAINENIFDASFNLSYDNGNVEIENDATNVPYVDDSAAATSPEFNAAQKQSELTDEEAIQNSFNISYNNDYQEDELNLSNVSKERTPDFAQLIDSPKAHNNTITLGDTPGSPIPITIGDSPWNPRRFDETPMLNRKLLPFSKKQSTFSDAGESVREAETPRRLGSRLETFIDEVEESFLSVGNSRDDEYVPSASEDSENTSSSEDESTFEGELPTLPMKSPIRPNIKCRCKRGCQKRSCKCLKNGVKCGILCHSLTRYIDCYNN